MGRRRVVFGLFAVILVLGSILFAVILNPPVERLLITGVDDSSRRLKVGATLQVSASGMLQDGTPAGPVSMKRLQLVWVTNRPEVVQVDDRGVLTAINPGLANVQVKSKNEQLHSRPITLIVE